MFDPLSPDVWFVDEDAGLVFTPLGVFPSASVAPAERTIDLAVAVEVDSGNAVTVAAEPVIHLSVASEADVAFSVELANTPTIDLSAAAEADTANSLTVAVDPVINLSVATEADVAFSVEVSVDELVVVEAGWMGAITTESAVVKARFSGDEATLTADPGSIEVEGVEGADDWFTFELEDLTADTEYTVEIASGLERWEGSFKTFPEGATSFTFAAGGDSGHSGGAFDVNDVSPNAPTWDSIAEDAPAFFIHMGDLHYRDISSNNVALFHQAYEDVLAGKCAAMSTTVPWVYCWDDHDFGGNDSNGNDPAKAAAAEAYRDCVPHYPLTDATGIWQTFVYGRVRFIVTDSRSQRSPKSATDNASKTLLGATQKAWLDGVLDAATEPLIVLILGNPWIQSVTAGSDSWGGYSTERAEIAAMFTEHDVTRRMLILSADAHMMAMDDGTNSQYDPSAISDGPRLAQLGGIDAGKISIGGPYSEGIKSTPTNQIYGLVHVEDEGAEITVTVEGYSVSGTTETLQQSLTFVAGQVIQTIDLSVAEEVDAAFDLIVANEPALALSLAAETNEAYAMSLDNAAPYRWREPAMAASVKEPAITAGPKESTVDTNRKEADLS